MLASKSWHFLPHFQSENGNKYSRWPVKEVYPSSPLTHFWQYRDHNVLRISLGNEEDQQLDELSQKSNWCFPCVCLIVFCFAFLWLSITNCAGSKGIRAAIRVTQAYTVAAVSAELWTLRTQDTSDPGHFGTSLVVRTVFRTLRHQCRSVWTVRTWVLNCLAPSAELSRPKCRSVLARVWRLRCNRPEGQINREHMGNYA